MVPHWGQKSKIGKDDPWKKARNVHEPNTNITDKGKGREGMGREGKVRDRGRRRDQRNKTINIVP